MTAPTLWLLVLAPVLAKTSAVRPQVKEPSRLVVSVTFVGVGIAFAESPERCRVDRGTFDRFEGIVHANKARGRTARYTGVLRRVTEQTHCGADLRQPGSRAPAEPCRAKLSGIGDVEAHVSVAAGDADHVWIVLRPLDVMAEVTGSCRPAVMREIRRAYADQLTFEIPLPEARLTPGRFLAPDEGNGRWEMTVTRAAEESSQ